MSKFYPWLALIAVAASARLVTHWLLPTHQLIGYVVTVVLAVEAKNWAQRKLSSRHQWNVKS
jgi:hypothetical protein